MLSFKTILKLYYIVSENWSKKWLLKMNKYFQPWLMFDFIPFFLGGGGSSKSMFKKIIAIFKKILSEISALLSR